jgi:hypothetical protein
LALQQLRRDTLRHAARVKARRRVPRLDSTDTLWKYRQVRLHAASWLAFSSLLGCLPESDDLSSFSSDWSARSAVAAPSSAAGDLEGGGLAPVGAAGARAVEVNGGMAGSAGIDSESEIDPIFVGNGGRAAAVPSSASSAGAAGSSGGAEDAPAPCSDGVLDAAQTTCYLVGAVPTNWQAARASCEQWQGALVKIDSPAEDKLVGELVTLGTWLGASDTLTENVFVWTDGSPITFGNWGPAQPDAFPGPDCIEKRTTVGGAWYDQPCFNERLYVCEKPLQ